jgi:hypothetical protein
MSLGHACERDGCDNPLTGRRDARYCSDRCRKADYREGRRTSEPKRCQICGSPFYPKSPKQRYCNHDDADEDCKDMQMDLLVMWEEAIEARMAALCTRDGCYEHTYREGRGRPRKYCSEACKQAHRKATRKARA